MRRFPWRSAVLLAPVMALAALALGCPKSSEQGSEGGGGEATTAVKPKGEMKEFEGKGTATLKGKVTLDGPVPEAVIKQKDSELEAAIEKHQDKDQCLAGTPSEKTEQEWRIGKDNGVQNVAVWVTPPKGQYFKLDLDKLDFPKTVAIDQPHCAFIPHVSVAFPSYYDPKEKKQKPTGQEVEIKNSAKMNHNTKWEGGTRNPGGNPILPPGKDLKLEIKADDNQQINLTCSIHGWMTGYIWALDTPFSAVTNENGEYEIKNVPAGAEVLVFAWHEPKDFVNQNASKGEAVTLKDGETLTKDFKVPSPAK